MWSQMVGLPAYGLTIFLCVCVCVYTHIFIHSFFDREYKLLSYKMNKILGSNVQHMTIVNNSVYLEIAKKIDFKSCHRKTNGNYAA